MTDGEAPRHHVVGEEERLLEAERLEHELLHRLLVRLAGDHLDHAAGEIEAGVVVRPHLAERRQLRQRRQRLAHARERVVAGAEVVEVVADPAAGVREQVPHRHARRDVLVAELQLRQIRAHRRVELELAALDEPHHSRAGERLRDRADLEQRVGRDLERVLRRRDAEAGDMLLALVQQPNGDARRVGLLHRRADRVADLIEDRCPRASTVTQNAAMSVDLVVLDDAERGRAPRRRAAGRGGADGGHIALSGGKTPELAHETAAELQPDWSRVELWWGDERCVPPDDERSNYAMAKRSLLDRLATPPAHVHRIRGELDPEAAADEYDAALHGVRLRLNVLGIGPDGHTASLFPHAPGLRERERLAIAAEPGLDPRVMRVTMTPPMLANADCVLFLVTGEEKADAAKRAFADPPGEATPASMIRSRDGLTIAVLDTAAASLLASI